MVDKAHQEAFDKYNGPLRFIGNVLLSGSYALDKDAAQDIDIAFPLSDWQMYGEVYKRDLELVEYSPSPEDDTYEEAAFQDEIIHLYRGKWSTNVIVVNDFLWPAYVQAHRIMMSSTDYFKDKLLRHNLFIGQKNLIRAMMGWEQRDFIKE